MKKLISGIYLLLFALSSYGQVLNNRPATSTTIEAFKYNPLYLTYEFPGTTVPVITPEIYVSGAKSSFVPTVSISGQIATVTLSAVQMSRLPPSSELYLKFGTGPTASYKIGAKILPSVSMGLPSTVPYTVTVSEIGAVKINVIGDAATAKQYMLQARAAKDSAMLGVGNQWTGKTIIWTGTSIPWSFGTDGYPDQIARKLGATMINSSISGSAIVFKTGEGGSQGMSGTYAELIAAGMGPNYSYENRIMPFLSQASCVVIDHMRNDLPFLGDTAKLGTLETRNKATFLGALNSVIDAVLAAKPTCRIILCTTPNGWEYGGQDPSVKPNRIALHKGRQAMIDLGAARGIPVWDMMSTSGINETNFGTWTTDGLHINQDMANILAVQGYRFFLGVN